MNATICISVLSIGLSCVYAGSRTLTALAETGFAPKVFAYGIFRQPDFTFQSDGCLFTLVDKSSRPLFSVVAILIFGPIAYVNCSDDGDTVCKLLNLCTFPGLKQVRSQMASRTLWIVNDLYMDGDLPLPVSLAAVLYHFRHLTFNQSIRFRAAWKAQGHSLEELPFKALGGVWGSWFGVIMNGLVLIAQFYVVHLFHFPLLHS